MLAAERIPFIGYHMPHPSAGYVEPFDTGFRFVPVSYQFLIWRRRKRIYPLACQS
ncbi:hypothetical protein [Sinorhizobium meliloti]|uniref:hypothetical protein n=1 Tax=Rhizobium meliloti TaxID=382 RepID=UPI00398C85AB